VNLLEVEKFDVHRRPIGKPNFLGLADPKINGPMKDSIRRNLSGASGCASDNEKTGEHPSEKTDRELLLHGAARITAPEGIGTEKRTCGRNFVTERSR